MNLQDCAQEEKIQLIEELDILEFPKLLLDLSVKISNSQALIEELKEKINAYRSKKYLDIAEERDIIGNRKVRKYSSQESREIALSSLLSDDLEWINMNTQLKLITSDLKSDKQTYEFTRRLKNILMVEYSNHGFRNIKQVKEHSKEIQI